MSNYLIEDTTLTDIADAIRLKNGTSSPIYVRDFAYEIQTLHEKYTVSGKMCYGTILAELLNAGLHIDTSGATDLAGLFQKCTASYIDLNSIDTSSATTLEYMFDHCEELLEVYVDNFITHNVGSYDHMFNACYLLETIDVSSFYTGQADSMTAMFNGCRALYMIDGLDRFVTSSVTAMNNMFNGCQNLSTLDLSSFDTYHATNMTAMFKGCSSLQEITFGPDWKSTAGQTYTDQTTGTWTNSVTEVSYTGLQNLLVAGRTLGAIEGTWTKS